MSIKLFLVLRCVDIMCMSTPRLVAIKRAKGCCVRKWRGKLKSSERPYESVLLEFKSRTIVMLVYGAEDTL